MQVGIIPLKQLKPEEPHGAERGLLLAAGAMKRYPVGT